jgi:hypothetical protein
MQGLRLLAVKVQSICIKKLLANELHFLGKGFLYFVAISLVANEMALLSHRTQGKDAAKHQG